eukprot:886447-Pleurochrysis_carterae.AAC.1
MVLSEGGMGLAYASRDLRRDACRGYGSRDSTAVRVWRGKSVLADSLWMLGSWWRWMVWEAEGKGREGGGERSARMNQCRGNGTRS